MGYFKRNGGIECFTPDDTETEMWIDGSVGYSFTEIRSKIIEKWPNVSLDDYDIRVTAEYIHTDCLTYDLYDSGDWTKYIKIELIRPI